MSQNVIRLDRTVAEPETVGIENPFGSPILADMGTSEIVTAAEHNSKKGLDDIAVSTDSLKTNDVEAAVGATGEISHKNDGFNNDQTGGAAEHNFKKGLDDIAVSTDSLKANDVESGVGATGEISHTNDGFNNVQTGGGADQNFKEGIVGEAPEEDTNKILNGSDWTEEKEQPQINMVSGISTGEIHEDINTGKQPIEESSVASFETPNNTNNEAGSDTEQVVTGKKRKNRVIRSVFMGGVIVSAGVFAVWPVDNYDPLQLKPVITKLFNNSHSDARLPVDLSDVNNKKTGLQASVDKVVGEVFLKGDVADEEKLMLVITNINNERNALGQELLTQKETDLALEYAKAAISQNLRVTSSEVKHAKTAFVASIDSAVGEAAVYGDISDEDKLGIVISNINNERIALGQPLLTQKEMDLALEYASELLGVDMATASKVVVSQNKVSNAIEKTSAEFKTFQKGTDLETAHAVVDSIAEKVPDINSHDLSSAVKLIASKNGISLQVAKAAVVGKQAENSVVNTLSRSTSPKNSEEEIYLNTQAALKASWLAQTSKGGLSEDSVTFSLEKQLGIVGSVADKLGSDNESVDAVRAQIYAEHEARLAGKPIETQQLLGKIAAAESIAKSKGYGFYETALFVADKVGSSQGIDVVAVNKNLSPLAKSIVTTHYEARKLQQEYYAATGAKPDHEKVISGITSKVVEAARNAGVTPKAQKDYAKYAVNAEALALGANTKDSAIALNREFAIIEARQNGLSDLAVIAVGAGVGEMAKASSNGEIDRAHIQKGLKEAVSLITRSGIPPESQKSAIADVEKFLGAKAAPAVDTSIDQIVEIATKEAKEKGLSSIDSAAYVAKARTEYKAREAGFTESQTAVAVARAQARSRSESMNFTEARVADIEQRAGNAEIAALAIPAADVNRLNHAIAVLESGSSLVDLPENNNQKGVEGVSVNDLAQVIEQLNRLETRFAALAATVNDSIELSNKEAQGAAGASRAIVQIQSQLNANTAELRSQRGALQAEIDRRASNNGWLSSRLCEIEASTGVFSNPAACKSEYARYRETTPVQTHQYAAPQMNSYSLPDESVAYKKTNVSFESSSDRIYAQIPDSDMTAMPDIGHVTHDACSTRNINFGYMIISSDNAVITNRNGDTQRVIKGSYVPGLGSVVAFQAAQDPRFISFENGIVCQQRF